ncbi:MAG: hypothetical protein JW870_07345 [Candidatus Delongbacteria bacterium]|nr:hypothetical protein [Candidatus Delongbacteria bacterium]
MTKIIEIYDYKIKKYLDKEIDKHGIFEELKSESKYENFKKNLKLNYRLKKINY